MEDPAEQARKFLRLLFEHKEDAQYIHLWQLHGKRSRFFQSIDDAAAFAFLTLKDIYFGVGLSPEDFGIDKRCPADKVAAIAGVWADIDFFHPTAHKKAGLPPSEEAAYKILKSMHAKPTLVVHSGYGLQAYWLFKEPWIFVDDTDRKRAADLCQRWNQFVVKRAADLGWSADSVGDLARIMRIPGSLNAKDPEEPRHVHLKYGNANRRFNPSELIEILDELKIEAGQDNSGQPRNWEKQADDGLIFSRDRQPPVDRLLALRKKSRKFANTIDHKRPDLKDQSTSGYDLALAVHAAKAGWSDQEIIDLLIYHQREKRTEGVRDRPEYFRETIRKARKLLQPDPAMERLKAANATPAVDRETSTAENGDEAERPPEDSPEFRTKNLNDLSLIFKVSIQRIIKTMSDPPLFRIETDRGPIAIGEVQNLIEQRALRNRVAMIGIYLRKRQEEEWEPIATALLRSCEPEEVTPDATHTGQLRIWIEDYFRDNNIFASVEDADRNEPFMKDAAVHISSSDLRKFLLISNGERGLTANALCQMLRASGAKPKRVAIKTKKGIPSTRYCWQLADDPAEFEQ